MKQVKSIKKPKKMKKETLSEEKEIKNTFGKIKINNLGIKKEGQKYFRTEKGKTIHPFPL
jgi:hypothetical protein